MRKACWLAVGWMVAARPVRADWKITTSDVDQGGGESVRTEYCKGDLRRTDLVWDGQVRPITVQNLASGTFTIWDATRKEYMIVMPKGRPHSVALPKADPATGPVVLTETSTIDTGERQTMFERTARHFITTEKQSRQETPGAEEKLEGETVKDEWYIDAGGLTAEVRGRYGTVLVAISSRNGEMPTMKTSHTGPVPSGLIVRQKTTWRSVEFSSAKSERSMQVRDLQEGALSQRLFEPPVDFKRVDKLPDASFVYQRTFHDEIETYWNSFENWLFSWF